MLSRFRIVLALLALALVVNTTGCGSGSDLPVVGIVQFASSSSLDLLRDSAIKGLASAGYHDGSNVRLQKRNALGDVNAARQILQELATQKVSLVVVIGTQTTQVADDFRSKYPIVFCGVVDPVIANIATTQTQAHTNVTGVYNPFSPEKGLQMLKEIMPTVTKVGSLYNSAEAFAPTLLASAQAEAARLGITWVAVPVGATTDVVSGTQALQAQGVQALMQLPSNTVNPGLTNQLAEALRLNMPFYSVQIDQVEKGVIAAVGIDLGAAGEQAGMLAGKVLGGAKPDTLPMQRAAKEPLYVNLTAAASFGVTVPASTIQRAEKVFGP